MFPLDLFGDIYTSSRIKLFCLQGSVEASQFSLADIFFFKFLTLGILGIQRNVPNLDSEFVSESIPCPAASRVSKKSDLEKGFQNSGLKLS